MEKVDCLFIHAPKSRNDCPPIDPFIGINFLPMGLLGLADLLQRHGVSSQIVHTGVVRGVLDDGTVMVESKFGLDGRYLHQPQGQPFSQTWAYYRSARGGHYVMIERTRWSHVSASRRKSGTRESDKIPLPITRTDKVG